MNSEIQQAENGLKIKKAVLECEVKAKESNCYSKTVHYFLSNKGYECYLFECSKKDKKFSWLKKDKKTYIQVTEPEFLNKFSSCAYFVEL